MIGERGVAVLEAIAPCMPDDVTIPIRPEHVDALRYDLCRLLLEAPTRRRRECGGG